MELASGWVAHGGSEGSAELMLFGLAVKAAAATICVYLIGVLRLHRYRAGRIRLPRWRASAFVAGVLVMLVVVSPPVDRVVHELFSVHMLQHVVLAFVAAPLLVLGSPLFVIGVALGRILQPIRYTAARWDHRHASIGIALGLAGFHVSTWYLWHLPVAYELALGNPVVHACEHAMLMASGMALTWHAMSAAPALGAMTGALVSMVGVAPLAALLVFASRSWYDSGLPERYGLTALEDQQLGGALMWFPGSLAYLAAVAAIVVRRLAMPHGELPTTSRAPYMPLS